MTADALQGKIDFSGRVNPIDVKAGIRHGLTYIGYGIMIIAYIFILVLSILTLGLIEIRQANTTGFNALIAKLDEKDWYREDYFKAMQGRVDAALTAYEGWKRSLDCPEESGVTGISEPGKASLGAAAAPPDGAATGVPQTACALANDHLNSLKLLKEDLLFKRANLPQWYDKYRDGIRTQTPQLIPILGLVDSRSRMVSIWARMPFELLEMLLLVCMGALGGMISVTRCLVDPSTANPAARDLCYRPVAGGVLALGIFILFRATQLFFGGQNTAATASTSVFLLAALGLASGFCAREALAQIEATAKRILRRAANGRDGDASGAQGPGPSTGAPRSQADQPAPA